MGMYSAARSTVEALFFSPASRNSSLAVGGVSVCMVVVGGGETIEFLQYVVCLIRLRPAQKRPARCLMQRASRRKEEHNRCLRRHAGAHHTHTHTSLCVPPPPPISGAS